LSGVVDRSGSSGSVGGLVVARTLTLGVSEGFTILSQLAAMKVGSRLKLLESRLDSKDVRMEIR